MPNEEKYLDLTGLSRYDSKIKEVIQKDITQPFSTSSTYAVDAYVVYNGLLYKCTTAVTTAGEWNSSNWTQVKLIDNIINPIKTTADGAIPKSTVTAAGDLIIGSGSGTVTKLAKGSNGKFLTISNGSIVWGDTVSANDGKLTINGATASDKIEFTANQSGNTTGTIDKTFVGLGNVANTGDSATPTQNGTDKFTTGGAYSLKLELEEEIRTQAAHFRGRWATWSAVPTSSSDYPEDSDGNKTPTANDYMIVTDASGYTEDTLTGTWRFTYTGVWSTEGKSGWLPAYQIENVPLSFKTINNETITGTGNITTPNYYHTPSFNAGLSIATGTGVNALYVPNANGTTQAGIVTTGAQTFGGIKTFSSEIQLPANGAKFLQGSSTYATLKGDSTGSSNITLTLPKSTGTIARIEDFPEVTFNTSEVSGGTLIKSITVGSDSYNLGTSAATSTANGTIKLFSDTVQSIAANTVSSTSGRTYGIQVNSSGQAVVNVPWTDTATATDNILDGSNSGTAITYAPYTSQQSKLSFDTSSTNPSRTDRLNLNGYFYAKNLYDNGSRVVNLADAQTITGSKTFVSSASASAIVVNYSDGVSHTNIDGSSISMETSPSSTSGSFLTYYSRDSISRYVGDSSYTLTLPNKSGTIALTNDIPYVTLSQSTDGTSGVTTTTWNYRAAGASGDPTSVVFQNISNAEIDALFA